MRIVAKLDRLSRSLRDVCTLVEELFSDERYHLLSLCYELSDKLDERGRRIPVPLAHEQEVLRQIESMRADGLKLREIARRLNEAKIPARRDGTWRAQRISIVLQRSGKHTVRPMTECKTLPRDWTLVIKPGHSQPHPN